MATHADHHQARNVARAAKGATFFNRPPAPAQALRFSNGVYKPNNSFVQARAIAPPVAQNLSIHAPCDADFFRFSTTDYVDLTVGTTGYTDASHTQPAAAPTITLYREQAFVQDSHSGSLTRNLLQPGTYHFKVDASQLVYYRLTVTIASSTILPDRFDDQTPPGEPRNDTFNAAAVIPGELQANNLLTMGAIDDLNHDITNDIDFFTIQLEHEYGPFGEPECCSTVGPDTTQGMFRLSMAPNTVRPFSIELYRPDGTFLGLTSGLSFTLPCPHQFAPDGKLKIRVRDNAGRNFYDIALGYNRCNTRFYPNWFLEFDPPAYRRLVPDFIDDYRGLYPMDPFVQERYFDGAATEPFPAEFLIFDQAQGRDYLLDIFLADGTDLTVTLLNDNAEVVAEAFDANAPVVAGTQSPPSHHKRLEARDLPAGMYFLMLSGGAFGTSFVLDADVAGDFDSDSDVDLRDIAAFQRCFGQTAELSSECAPGDLTGDGRVDLGDVPILIRSITGPH